MIVDSPVSIIKVSNFLNRKGYNTIVEHGRFSKLYLSVFEKEFAKSRKEFYDTHKEDLCKEFNLKCNFKTTIGCFVSNYIPKDLWCEYDSVTGYLNLIKLYKSKLPYDC